jgi:hypothetical protein
MSPACSLLDDVCLLVVFHSRFHSRRFDEIELDSGSGSHQRNIFMIGLFGLLARSKCLLGDNWKYEMIYPRPVARYFVLYSSPFSAPFSSPAPYGPSSTSILNTTPTTHLLLIISLRPLLSHPQDILLAFTPWHQLHLKVSWNSHQRRF